MGSGNKDLAPAPITPAPSPEIAEPARRAAPKPKQKRIPRLIVAATELLLAGKAKNIADAARQLNCSREYISKTLSKRPDCVAFMQQRAARTVGVASAAAAARMAALLHAGSEHVQFRASEFVLGASGIAPANQPQVSVNIEMKAGYVIDLSEPGQPEQKIIAGQVIDAKPADTK